MLVYNFIITLTFSADIGRKPASPARAPWEPATLKRRQEPASPVLRRRQLMKRPTAQHGGARTMESDSMGRIERDNPKTINRSGVYIYNDDRRISNYTKIIDNIILIKT